MGKKILLLTPADKDKTPTKVLDKELKLIKSYPQGMKYFYFDEIETDNFHNALEKIFKLENSFMVLGELTDEGRTLMSIQEKGVRRKKGPKATIKDKISDEIVLDLDDHEIPGFDALDPEPGIIDFLYENNINCDVTWQITSQQKLNTELARIRLFMECTKPKTLQYRKAWSQKTFQSDGSVYTACQPIYTAPPQIVGKDPIPKRHGFIKGKRKKIILPKLEDQEFYRESGFRTNSDYNFEDTNIPEEVLEGRVFRRYFMPLAFHYANKIKDREAIFYIIQGKSSKVKNREFDDENVLQYIDDALKIIKEEEKEEKKHHDNLQEILEEADQEIIPEFPKNLLSEWPEPWPMLWENFKSIPRELEESLIVPTIIALNSFALRANFVTGRGRRPNMFFLNLAPSTGNKDVNSKNVILALDNIFKREGKLNNIFSGILNVESNITADSTFLQSFSEDGELFWINTEATRIFQQIGQSGNISSVAALSDKLIEVVDGSIITGKIKASGKVKTIEDPNCQVVFYAQPETIERHVNDDMVDSGLFGRALISIIPKLKIDKDKFKMFDSGNEAKMRVSRDFIEFYCDPCWLMADMNEGKTVLSLDDEQTNILNKWAVNEILPYLEDDDILQKLLKRIGIAGEQLYVVILAICRMYDIHQGRKPREKIDPSCMFSLLEYWRDTKIYSVKNLVNTQVDPLAEEIVIVVKELLKGKIKPRTETYKKMIKVGYVPIPEINRVVLSRKSLISKLQSKGEDKNVTERLNRLLDVLTKNDVFAMKELDGKRGKTKCVTVLH